MPRGGVLVIGRNDEGVAVGVKDAEKLLEVLPNKIRDILGIVVDVNLVTEAGKELVEIHVEPYPSPISSKGEYHFRSGSTKQELKGAALQRFLMRKQGRHWDDAPVPGFKAEDCSQQALQLFKAGATASGRVNEGALQDKTDALLESLQLRDGQYFKRAAALLFSDNPERHVSGAYIKVGFFVTDDDLRYQDEIHGNLFSQAEKTLEIMFSKYLKGYISYAGLQRRETFLFPYLALREALLHAIVHKDYSSGIPTQISVYDDKVVLWNSGQLPQDWTLEQLLGKHPSAPCNPLIADAFFRAGYIESWGRGIEKINHECRQHGIEPPLYDTGMSGLMLTFQANPEHLVAALGEDGGGTSPERKGRGKGRRNAGRNSGSDGRNAGRNGRNTRSDGRNAGRNTGQDHRTAPGTPAPDLG
ncbi:MAG: ATP-dependent DNA helicase [Halieaceae bacterium]|nr:ATP-dependent DNA helicase [Halieaceae bacterium]